MIKETISVASMKFFVMIGLACGSLAAWSMDHFENKEHADAVREGEKTYLKSIDEKLNILLQRTQ